MALDLPRDSFLYHSLSFLCSSCCSGVAEAVTFPLDTIKVRLQLAHNSASVSTQGFYQGFSAAFARQFFYGGASVTLYPRFREAVGSISNTNPDDLPFIQRLVSGSLSGSTSQLLASPFDVVKIRMQGSTGHAYKGTCDALNTIAKTEGIKGLWRGCGPNMQRAAVLNGFWLSTYDQSKRFVREDLHITNRVASTLVASTLAGFVCVAATCPFDVAKTRMMNQTQRDTTKYTSMVQCIRSTAQAEGLGALYKGFVPSLARMGPWSVVFFLVYEPVCEAVFGQSNF